MRWCGRWSRRRRGNWRRRNDHGGNPATVARTFDAENHTLTTSESAPTQNGGEVGQGSTVSWGPNGHPILVGSNYNAQVTQSDTLHWNGDTLLFTTTPQGQLDDIKIGSAADILPLDPTYKGLTFYDRDPSGGAMGCHNATGATFIGTGDAYTRPMHGKNISGTIGISPCTTDTHYAIVTGAASMPTSIVWWTSSVTYSLGEGTLQVSGPQIGQGGVLGMPRTDGLADGTDAIQGVRTYDSNAGTWTTPDAYAGDVDDPASQKSYMWNGNNPETYADPTGFVLGLIGDSSQRAQEMKDWNDAEADLEQHDDMAGYMLMQHIKDDPNVIVNFRETTKTGDDSFWGHTDTQAHSFSHLVNAGARIIGTIYWNPHSALQYPTAISPLGPDGQMSPSVALLHEAAHAADRVDPNFDPQFSSTIDEWRVMGGPEADAQHAKGWPTRGSHTGTWCTVQTVTQTC